MPNVHSPSLDSVEAGAPEAEIKITPEMIEAGVNVFRIRYAPGFYMDSDRSLIQEIFVAMYLAGLSPS